MTVSEDPSTGTNQKASAFWTRIHSAYNGNVARANKNREADCDWKVLTEDCPASLLKSEWYLCLQSAIQMFAGLVAKFPPASRVRWDDSKMDLYWKSMRLMYKEQVSEGLPNNFAPYMSAYHFLCQHSKFSEVLEPNKKSGDKKKVCRMPAVNTDSSHKPSASLVNSTGPIGRDSTKKKKAAKLVIEVVS